MRSYKPRVVGTNLQGYAVGEDNPAARHPDSVVAEVRAMHVAGMTESAIARATGIHAATVGRWLRGERRAQPPVRFISRPVRAEPSAMNREPKPAEQAPARDSALGTLSDTANLTVKERP